MELDDAIGQVSQLYRTVTGRDLPASEAPYAPIPAEKDPVAHVQEQVDRLLGLLAGPALPNNDATWVPPISIYESDVDVTIAVDVPGTSRDRVDVRLQGGVLVIAGQRAPSLADGQALRRSEARFGGFARLVPLPPGLRTMDMTARLEAGVLEVRIPREAANGVRRIDVVS
ncbi:MAG TPA: Hsp20/alpha crystallin family protein [Polyangiaceae bacterium]|nr:Hsp20/alpha crystallin family protein [Polyangiaceae bacterium]